MFARTSVRALVACCLVAVFVVQTCSQTLAPPVPPLLRPPAVPLVTHDPYFSVWAMSDTLAGERTKHWTGAAHGMVGMARIDGKPHRFMGQSYSPLPAPMRQLRLEVFPTRSVYEFEAEGVRLRLTFLSPLLPDDLEVLARPVTYLTWDAWAVDGRKHQVSLYFDCTAEFVVNTTYEKVVWSRPKVGDLSVLTFGSQEQPLLERAGDDLRIDWGYLHLAVSPPGAAGAGNSDVIAWNQTARNSFAATGALPDSDDMRQPRMAREEMPVLATTFDLGEVAAAPVSRHLMLAYDDVYSVEYFKRRLRPYWRREGREADALLKTAARDYETLKRRSEAFDAELMTDLRRVGGEEYARLAALAFRQTIAAHKLAADWDGTPLFFSKENYSNGSIATVDVTYPSAPFFLLLNPRLLEAQLRPVFDYAASPRWRFPFAPHDLGTYPLANGQTYGGRETSETDQMPVEESGNMLLLTAALARADGHARFAEAYWPLLTRWAEYLRDKGLDPENQLSTDDFAGHLAHNTNLSLKAILALGSYAMLADLTGRKAEARTYRRLAEEMAAKWIKIADDGDHYRLAFDKPGTWSQKYNLVWDKLLGLKLFPAQVARRELDFYRAKQNRYGLPLDNRESYTKLDWIVWTATLADSQEEFRSFITPLYKFVNETPDRVPLTDWYGTLDAKQRGFQARSVVGGIYIKMLEDAALWKKWSRRAAR
ncbi:MAG TPA: DUF4965 domain-containing protein [Pyrinomonadaceae bacterium]|jgi:hypothetical protein|nr:DUF4965 domain-containing protein [Pyrinomonadaceae bacterium]